MFRTGGDDAKEEDVEDAADDVDFENVAVYGHKLGRWIGECVHDRLSLLRLTKEVHSVIVGRSWDSGILHYLQRQGFMQQLVANVPSLSKKEGRVLVGDLWSFLEGQCLDRPDGEHFAAEQVAAAAASFLRGRRRADIYRIAVECSGDARCFDAKTFDQEIGSDEVILAKFLQRVLVQTAQCKMGSVDAEWSGQRIHFLLSSDVFGHGVEFEEWLSGLVYDPVTLWLNEREVREFVAADNLHDARCIRWGKERFIKFRAL